MTPAWIRRLARNFAREDGNATIEFVILFPAFLALAVSGVEMGVLTLRQVMLERGIDITVRDLRIGKMVDPDFDKARAEICSYASIIPDCNNVLHLELNPVSTTTWDMPSESVACVNRADDIKPVVKFDAGARNEFMLMRACAVFDPFFPSFGIGPKLPLDDSGGYRLVASTAFVNEP